MRAQPLLHLLQRQLQEPLGVLGSARGRGDDLVHEPGRHELFARDALAHDEGLVGLGDAEAFDEGAGGAAFGDEAEGGEGREKEGVRGGVDEVRVGDQRGGEADGGAVQGDDEDLRVGVEGPGQVDVVGDEGAEVTPGGAGEEVASAGAGDAHVRAAGGVTFVSYGVACGEGS